MSAIQRLAAAAAALVLVQATAAFGQAATATVRGRVDDAQGRPVASATVTVTAPDTGLTRTVPTAGDGTFAIASLPPAAIDVTVSASGFAEARRPGIVLEVG